ncbi:thioredoxin family protein [Candidatus Bathyarchaeota archaeon]|nr:thioredoxin family protein [Candidatus Bathyarchaeota archaeon]
MNQDEQFESEGIKRFSALLPSDFVGKRLLKKERVLAIFYADWCPFCRRIYPYLRSLSPGSHYAVYRVDMSDEDNDLWDSFGIVVVPTLIAFDEGEEFWRADGVPMVGLKIDDFRKADSVLKAKAQK